MRQIRENLFDGTDEDLTVEQDGLGRRGSISRRKFIRRGVIGAAMATTAVMTRNNAAGAEMLESIVRTHGGTPGTGLVPAGPELALPPGFSYKTFGWFGSAMSDGFLTPPIHDGMGVFPGPNGNYRIVRNHELGEGNDVPAGTVIGDPATAYDRKSSGGTVTLEVTSDGELVDHFISLNGTNTNCAGAPTPWDTWLTMEETTTGIDAGHKKAHGYVFEVRAKANGAVRKQPIKGMGRMLHEAGAVDPQTGVVYMTEDEGPDGFYRYVPNTFGKLRDGGVLQMLKVVGERKYNTIRDQTVGEVLPVRWVTIDDPDPVDAEENASAVFLQGRKKGAAKFLGGEGCTWVPNDASVAFGSSEGGDAALGQAWRYKATLRRGELDERGTLTLRYESTSEDELDGPDNFGTSPSGAVLIAEDGDETSNFVRALLPDGSLINVAENLVGVQLHYIEASGKIYDPTVPDDGAAAGDGIGHAEFAGPQFSPDGTWLFVNIQVPGITCAITGPWGSIGL
ncbi:MAG: alkaline phosphatase PhoX [Actinomycetota bacterium]